ncbi:MAG TPA: DegT/DnrJ/EryC1/StrS family aminotransferase, partial [Puia sp.]|nr:DegT/DnrJ/EryC1/StrS family aminotransferase [Puia sp.]
HYIPVHRLPYYQALGWKKGDFPHAEKYYEECLSLPMYPTLSGEEQQYVINCVDEFFEGN